MIRYVPRPQIGNKSSNNKRYSRERGIQGHHKLPTARLTWSLVVQFRPKTDPASKINQSYGIQRSSRRSLIQRWTPRCQRAKAIRGRGHARRCPFPITRHPLSQRGCPRSSECNFRFTRFIFARGGWWICDWEAGRGESLRLLLGQVWMDIFCIRDLCFV